MPRLLLLLYPHPPPPPLRLRQCRILPPFRFRVLFPALPLVRGNSSSAFASGPEHSASRSTTSVAPAMVDQNSQNELFRDFIAIMNSHKLASTAASSLASVQSDSSTRLVYTAAPSDRPFSARRYTSRSLTPAGSGKRLRVWGEMGAAGAPTP